MMYRRMVKKLIVAVVYPGWIPKGEKGRTRAQQQCVGFLT